MFSRFVKYLFKINGIMGKSSIQNTSLKTIFKLYQIAAISFGVLMAITILKFIIWPLIFITKAPLSILFLLLVLSYMYMEYVIYTYSDDIERISKQ